MSGEFTNIEGVLAEAQNQNYYDLLIKQLSKDLMRVGDSPGVRNALCSNRP